MSRPSLPFTIYEKSNGYWYYSINPSSGVPAPLCEKRKSTGETGKGPALRHVNKRIRELVDGSVKKTDTTLKAYASKFYTEGCPHCSRMGPQAISDETKRNRRNILERHILSDPIVNQRMADLLPEHLGAFRERMFAKDLASTTVRRIESLLGTVLKEAVINRKLQWNPYDAMAKLPKQGAERGVFTVEQLRALFEDRPGVWPDDEVWVCFRIAAVLGLRSAEVRALQWQDIAEDSLVVRHSLGGGGSLKPPKWGKIRTAPLPGFLAGEIEDYREDRIRVASGDFLFCSEFTGATRPPQWWAGRWKAAAKAVGIPEQDTEGRKLSPHCFRHTLQSLMIERHVSPALAGLMLGHTTSTGLTSVQQAYTHADLRRASLVDVLEDIFVVSVGA